jgi:hypothetical protein
MAENIEQLNVFNKQSGIYNGMEYIIRNAFNI